MTYSLQKMMWGKIYLLRQSVRTWDMLSAGAYVLHCPLSTKRRPPHDQPTAFSRPTDCLLTANRLPSHDQPTSSSRPTDCLLTTNRLPSYGQPTVSSPISRLPPHDQPNASSWPTDCLLTTNRLPPHDQPTASSRPTDYRTIHISACIFTYHMKNSFLVGKRV